METNEIKLKEALEIIAKKRLISEPTFLDWCKRGVIKYRIELHGPQKTPWKIFKRSDIEKLRDRLPKGKKKGRSYLADLPKPAPL